MASKVPHNIARPWTDAVLALFQLDQANGSIRLVLAVSDMVVTAQRRSSHAEGSAWLGRGFDPVWTSPHPWPDWVPQHMEGRNYICDGHVKWARDSQMYVALFPEKWNWRCQ